MKPRTAVDRSPGATMDSAVNTVAVALGTVAEMLAATEATQPVGVTALMDVPANGTYTIHAGFGESSQNIVLLDVNGKPLVKSKAGVTAWRREAVNPAATM